MRAFDVRNGKGLEMTLVADRGLDIPVLRYKGVNVSFASKVGLRAPSLYTEDAGRGFLKQFYAGMLTTCGITYAGAACEDGGRQLGLHGNYDNTPAAKVAFETVYEGDEAILRLLELREREKEEQMADIKGEMKKIEWGSQIRSYVFQPYTMVKDHRTGYESGNVDDVMDGNLDGFITAYLKMQ